MSKLLHVLCALGLWVTALGPAGFLPNLTPTAPTLSATRPTTPSPRDPAELLMLSPLLMGAIVVKDLGAVAAKFKARAQAAQPDYAAGVNGAAGRWEQAAAASEETYKASVIEAANKGRYGAGVRGSAGKYQKNATTLGPQRYAQGIGNAQEAYAAGMGPVLQTIGSLTLPPRQVKGMNQERSNIVATALRRLKVGA